jgi:hypothetical protein
MTETKLIGSSSWVEGGWIGGIRVFIEYQYIQTCDGVPVARFKIREKL